MLIGRGLSPFLVPTLPPAALAAPPAPANLVVIGTFDSAAGWTLPADCSIAGGVLVKAAGPLSRLVTRAPASPLVPGAVYKVGFDVTARAAGGPRAVVGGQTGLSRTAVGSYQQFIKAGAANTVGFSFLGSVDASVDNLVVVPAVETGVGPELVQDPGCDTGVGWSLQGGATMSSGKLNLADGSEADTQLSVAPVPGQAYRITFTIDSLTGGSVAPGFGGFTMTPRTAAGTYTEDMVAGIGAGLGLPATGGSAVIDNVSVKQILYA